MPVTSSAFRSVLFAAPHEAAPTAGSQVPRRSEAVASAASILLFDLEDTVPESEKAARRKQILDVDVPRERTWVRINHEDHAGWAEDIRVAAATASIVMVPKVESPDQLARVGTALHDAGAEDVGLVALVETARGLRNLDRICSQGEPPLALVAGIGDLTRDTNTQYTGIGEFENYVRAQLVEASAAHSLTAPIDTASLFVGDTDFLRDECRLAKRMGFTSKLCLTLQDVEVVMDEFGVTDAEIDHALAIVHAYQCALDAGQGQVVARGVIVDVPTVERAKDVLRASGRDVFTDDGPRRGA
ncbi:aldolase/citrate lyase family protein [Rhodococcus sp. USK13]|uniref:HpcH/HpaI aldolase/citrate lyase family protein n=1 Tax=Rhodococcus sp. USK13 TaxID=2806442 RepID=UPI001BD088EC|nr:aldolase/citrate lyase family protein [Rhodococcus sp. USK13]